MARLNPDHFPDRFALDRYARQMRNDEMARIVRALIGRIADALRSEPKPSVRAIARAQRT
ncbi:MAG: hypothetical protein U1F15_15990 [Burkholderiales bacterium]